jgi:hypothetical protein
MFNPSRHEVRLFFCETWRKNRSGENLTGLESVALSLIAVHPEYHSLLDDPGKSLERDYSPDSGQLNPFLHLSLHLAVEEQISIDQPHGIRPAYQQLLVEGNDDHDAKHLIIECLGEILWQSQRLGTAPDETLYLDGIRKHHQKKTGL